MKIIRHIFSTLFYITAGIFIFKIILLSFLSQPSWLEKLNSIDTSIIYAVLAIMFGAIFIRFRGWAKATSIAIVLATTFSILVKVTIFYLSLLPEFREAFPDNNFYDFSDYRTGCITIFILLFVGSVLFELHKSQTNS